jgi:hypothetical protein
MQNTKEQTEENRQWDSWHEVYLAKRHRRCKHHHAPKASAMIEADLYCIKHDLPYPASHA